MEMLHDDEEEEEERLGCLHDENTYRKATWRWAGGRREIGMLTWWEHL
jgi:hypothetical protein